MYPTVLDATGYALLLASFITLVILSREGCKRKKTSPFYILSTSDVFSTILTAISTLFVSRMETGIKLIYNWQNDTSDTPNRTWTIKDEGEHRLLFSRIRELRGTTDEIDSNVTLTCDVREVLAQYGMLLAPLTNAFVSLLTFTVQCNLNAACLKRRCANIVASPASDARSESSQKRGILEEEQESASQQPSDINVKSTSNVMLRIMRASKFRNLKEDDKKPAGLLVISHWLVPLLVVATLYFAEYNDMNNARHTDGTECLFESNFPVNDFYVFSDTKDNLKTIDSSVHATPLENYYLVDEEWSNKSHPNSTEVNRIVSEVQNIVGIVLNYIYNSTENTGNSSDSSGARNITEYVVTDNTDRIRDNVNTDGVTQRIHHTAMEQDNASDGLDIATFGSLSRVTQTPVRDKNDSYRENAEIYLARAEGDTTRRTINMPTVQDTRTLSNNQIYADIMKRIQAASPHAAVKSYRNRPENRHYDKKQPKRNNLIEYIAGMKPDPIEDSFFSHNTNTETKNGSLYMTNECLLSIKFLKLHLFILSIAIYFIPILLCCILQLRGKHICENTLAILNAKAGFISTLLRSNVNSNKYDNEIILNEPDSDSLSTSDKRICHQSSKNGLDTLKTRDDCSGTTDIEATSKKYDNCVETSNKNALSEIDSVSKIFRIIKLSLISCIVLWTPIFLGTLLRVFSCIRAPQWLTDITFLGAISFGIIRNILNIKIIKSQEFCSNGTVKENRIHPIE